MEYYLSRMTYSIPIKQGRKKLQLESDILQLVKASDKEKARDAVRKDFLKQHPDGIVLEVRIMDSIISE